MKLRQQQKADEARRYREEQRVLLESGAGPTTTPISGEQTDPWPIIADAAARDADAYATKVKEAAVPQIERAYRGGSKLLGSMPGFGGDFGPTETDQSDFVHGGMSFGPEGERVKTGGADLNAVMDFAYGTLNTLFSPLAPPMEAALKPALESEGGQQFVQGLDTLGTGIEDLTGITKENQLDSLMLLGVPAAAHYAGKGIKAGAQNMAKRIIDADAAGAFGGGTPKPQGIPEIALPDFEARDYSVPQKSPEVAALEDELDAGRWIDQQETKKRGKAPNRLRVADPSIDLPNEIASDAFNTMGKTIREGMDAEPWWMQPTETRVKPLAADRARVPQEAAPEFYDQSKTPLYNRISAEQKAKAARSPLDELDNEGFGKSARDEAYEDYLSSGTAWTKPPRDNAGFIIPRKLEPDAAKAPPASMGVKVKPGQSLWELLGGSKPKEKSFQAGDDYLRAANQKKIDEYASAPNPLKDVDIDQLVPMQQAKPGAAANVQRAVTIMPEGRMAGKSSGSKNVPITTQPTVSDIANATKASSYGEARFLVEPDGVVHTWTADHGWHDDIAEFIGVGDDAYRGLIHAKDLRAAQASGAKTMTDVIEFTQNKPVAREAWSSFKSDTGLGALPEWQASSKALADSYAATGTKPSLGVNSPEAKAGRAKWFEEQRAAQSPVEQLDSGTIDKPQPPKNWLERREDRNVAWQDDMRPKRPLKPGEPSFNTKLGYMRDESKRPRTPVEEFDNPDPKSAERAAARARADETFAYKEKQPAARMPERNGEIKDETRRIWLDPNRPFVTPKRTDASLPAVLANNVTKEGGTVVRLKNKVGGWIKRTKGATKSRPRFDEAVAAAKAKVGEDFVAERSKAFGKWETDRITATELANRTNKAIEDHIAMTPEQRLVNYAAAEAALRETMGNSGGGIYSFLSPNKKLQKNSEGYIGQEPITLPNGQPVESTGMSLLPYEQRKGFNTCPAGQPCKDSCLGITSGGNKRYKTPRIFQGKKTNALLDYPEATAVALFEDIARAQAKATARGNVLSVRLNVISDLDPKVWAPIIKHFDDTLFIDYSKMQYSSVAPNHHITYSSTGVSNDMTMNVWSNWDRMRRYLDQGENVAMAFSTKKTWPKWVYDIDNAELRKVVDGVSHDFRVVDLQNKGREGVIVGLKNMDENTLDASFNKNVAPEKDASVTSKGFFVKYDPNAKTYQTVKPILDPEGNVIPPGDIAYIPRQPSKAERIGARSAKPGESGAKTGPQTQISVGGRNVTPLENEKMRAAPSQDQIRRGVEKARIDHNILDSDVDPSVEQALKDVLEQGKPVKGKSFEEEYPTTLRDKLFSKKGDPLTKTIHGDKIPKGAYVVGRREHGGEDRAANPRKLAEIMAKRMRKENPDAGIKFVFDEDPDADFGVYNSQLAEYSDGSRKVEPVDITLNTARGKTETAMTLGHESGHALERSAINKNFNEDATFLDHAGNEVPFERIHDVFAVLNRKSLPREVAEELPALYHDTYPNPGFKRMVGKQGRKVSPLNAGYTKASVQPEQLAQAVQLYFYHPAKIKAQYPHTAKWISKNLSNEDVVFNEMGAGAGLAGVMATKFLAEQQQGDR